MEDCNGVSKGYEVDLLGQKGLQVGPTKALDLGFRLRAL